MLDLGGRLTAVQPSSPTPPATGTPVLAGGCPAQTHSTVQYSEVLVLDSEVLVFDGEVLVLVLVLATQVLVLVIQLIVLVLVK